MPLIEKNAELFANAVEAVKRATVDHVYNLGQNLSRQELVVLVDSLDFTALVNGLGYERAVDDLLGTYVGVLGELEGIAPVSETVLQALANTDRSFYLGKGTDLANTIKQELTRGALQGLSRDTMRAAIADVSGFTAPQVRTIIDTSVRVFSRSVTAAMADNLPDTAKYIYVGPVDDKTRDICLAMVAAGPLTQAEVDAQFPGGFVDGGGFNCRHSWRLVTSQSNKIEKQGEAESIISKNPPNTTPQTELEKSLAK